MKAFGIKGAGDCSIVRFNRFSWVITISCMLPIMVVLPDPNGAMIAKNSPHRTSRDTASRTVRRR